jgi:hypothetical protein
MQHTPGQIKAFVNVFYTNAQGIKQHMMSFQLATADTRDEKAVSRVRAVAVTCEEDHSKMQDYIKAAIDSVMANDYDLTLEFGVMV